MYGPLDSGVPYFQTIPYSKPQKAPLNHDQQGLDLQVTTMHA